MSSMGAAFIIVGAFQLSQAQQVNNCYSTGDNKCFNDYTYKGSDGATCDAWKKDRICSKVKGENKNAQQSINHNTTHAIGKKLGGRRDVIK